MDDSLFLAASDAEVLSGSETDPALLPPSSSHNARPRTDEERQERRFEDMIQDGGRNVWHGGSSPSVCLSCQS